MYCDINSAFSTPSDLLQTQPECVYDNIIGDSEHKTENHEINMFSAQGELNKYDGFCNDGSLCIKRDTTTGTPISELQNINTSKKIPEQKHTSHKFTRHDEKQIRNIIDNKFNDIVKKTKKNVNINQHNMREIRDGVILTLIGIIILSLIDILVRIVKTL